MTLSTQHHEMNQRDKRVLWHPFTQMKEWDALEQRVIVRGEGVYLIDMDGNRLLDGVSSMWCNVHGHSHPRLNAALQRQAATLEHSTMLGLTHPLAIELAEALVAMTPQNLTRVFYSDNGSTAVEVGVKIAYQYFLNLHGEKNTRKRFIKMTSAYHGDTLGAVSVGGVDLFHAAYGPLLFLTATINSPYCYRCPVGCADNTTCNLACLEPFEQLLTREGDQFAGCVIEPMMQGAGGMIPYPAGMLRRIADACRKAGVLLICDEVATGFYRTGPAFAVDHEGVEPDILCLSKGITAGYMPLAATLVTDEIYQAFYDDYMTFKTFYHGHTYTGHPLACAVALENLTMMDVPFQQHVTALIAALREHLEQLLRENPFVGNIRQCGLMSGVEIVRDRATKEPFPLANRTGFHICRAATERGIFLRPLGDTLVIMPPHVTSRDELASIFAVLPQSIGAVCQR